MKWFVALFSALFLFVLASSAHVRANTLLDYNDVFALEYAASAQFFNDAQQLIYVRRSMDRMSDSLVSSVWHFDFKTGKHVPILDDIPGLSQVVLSAQNDKVAYVADGKHGPQIYVLYIESGRSHKISQLTQAPQYITWSVDGKHLYFLQKVETTKPPLFTEMPLPPEGATWAEPAKVIDSVFYRADGPGYITPGSKQVFRIPANGGMPEKLTNDTINYSGPLYFSPDGSLLFMHANAHINADLHPFNDNVYALNTESKEIVQITDLEGSEFAPKVSPDGEWLAYLYIEDKKMSYQFPTLMLQSLETGKVIGLTSALDRDVESFAWSEDSSSLLFSYLDAGKTRLAKVQLNGDLIGLSVELGGQSLGRPYTSGEFTVSTQGDIAFTSATWRHPAELMLLNKDGKLIQLTELNTDWIAQRQLASLETLNVVSSIDELDIDAWMALPPDFDPEKRYPLILEIHGGPHAAYGPQFSMEVQLMAAKGYVVVWANPRGSSSYGAQFGNLIHHNYPSDDYQDLMDVVNIAIQKPYIDGDNIFITGGSGGGVLTAWSIGKTDRFNAAVVAKPVINWVSFALTADAYPYFTQYWMPAMPWDDHAALWARSPLSLVGKVNTPTMLLTGEADYRTPISESEQYYQALQLRQIDSVMVRIPGASHGIAARPSHLMQKVGYIIAWFDKHKKAPALQ